ncbi:hypothetical protein C0995_008201 [Termitomyces sp. Mi166|nr:hypothetical protein C0995_008201 [Termitomyces sp. Mi166\
MLTSSTDGGIPPELVSTASDAIAKNVATSATPAPTTSSSTSATSTSTVTTTHASVPTKKNSALDRGSAMSSTAYA